MAARTSEFDFRRPSKLGRDVGRSLDLAHETFARRVGTAWGSELRAYVSIDPASTAQLPYDDVIRSMPSQHLLVTAIAPPLPGAVVIELDLQLGMLLVDRLLGGEQPDSIGGTRRPSEVETELLGHLGHEAVLGLHELLEGLGGHDPRVSGVEISPQLVQVAKPSDPTLLVTFSVTVSGPLEARGTMSIIYPGQLQQLLLDHVASSRLNDSHENQADPEDAHSLLAGLGGAEVDLAVHLQPTAVAASDLHRLRVDDVLRLSHRVGRPAKVVVGGAPVLMGHLGRLGPRAAVQVTQWCTRDDEVPVSGSLALLARREQRPTTTTDEDRGAHDE